MAACCRHPFTKGRARSTVLFMKATPDRPTPWPRAANRRPPAGLLICDLDNTLYDFPAYFEAGLERSVPIAATSLALTRPAVLEHLRAVYTTHGSVEYPWAFHELPAVAALPAPRRKRLSSQLTRAFWAGAMTGLRPYPGVGASLSLIKSEGFAIVAVTNAPIHEAMRRLRAICLLEHLDGIAAAEWFRRPRKYVGAPTLRELPGFVDMPRRFLVRARLRRQELKPNTSVYIDIANKIGVGLDQVTVIGDSIERDLRPAQEIGMHAVWARYGKRNIAAEALFMSIVPFRLPEARESSPSGSNDISGWQPAVDCFPEIIALLPIQQELPLIFNS